MIASARADVGPSGSPASSARSLVLVRGRTQSVGRPRVGRGRRDRSARPRTRCATRPTSSSAPRRCGSGSVEVEERVAALPLTRRRRGSPARPAPRAHRGDRAGAGARGPRPRARRCSSTARAWSSTRATSTGCPVVDPAGAAAARRGSGGQIAAPSTRRSRRGGACPGRCAPRSSATTPAARGSRPRAAVGGHRPVRAGRTDRREGPCARRRARGRRRHAGHAPSTYVRPRGRSWCPDRGVRDGGLILRTVARFARSWRFRALEEVRGTAASDGRFAGARPVARSGAVLDPARADTSTVRRHVEVDITIDLYLRFRVAMAARREPAGPLTGPGAARTRPAAEPDRRAPRTVVRRSGGGRNNQWRRTRPTTWP